MAAMMVKPSAVIISTVIQFAGVQLIMVSSAMRSLLCFSTPFHSEGWETGCFSASSRFKSISTRQQPQPCQAPFRASELQSLLLRFELGNFNLNFESFLLSLKFCHTTFR